MSLFLSPQGRDAIVHCRSFLVLEAVSTYVVCVIVTDVYPEQPPADYHGGAQLTRELVWVCANMAQLPHPSVRQSS